MRHLRLILSSLFLITSLVFVLRSHGVLLWQEITHRNDFAPAPEARVTEAKCTNWNLFLVHDCKIRFAAAGMPGESEIHFGGFGRTEGGKFKMLHARSEPGIYTTDAALGELNNTVEFVTLLAMVLAAIPLGLVLRMRRLAAG